MTYYNNLCYNVVYITVKKGGNMKEYGIYIRQGAGTPYMIYFFDNIDSAKLKVYEMILLEEEISILNIV